MWNAFLIVKPIGMAHFLKLLSCILFGFRIKSPLFSFVKITPFVIQPMTAKPLQNKSLFKLDRRAFKNKRLIINVISLQCHAFVLK